MNILIACPHFAVASGRYYTRAFKRLGHTVKTIGPAMGDQIWGMRIDPQWVWEPEPPGGDWLPDIAINCYHEMILEGRLGGAAKVLIGVDNHVMPYDFPGVSWRARFLAHSWAMGMNKPNTHWLPAAYDPEAFGNQGRERDLDVAMVAVPYDNRMALMHRMVSAGLNVFGAMGLLWDDYNGIYNRAKIALCQSACGDVPTRVFENMAQGCCVLADRQTDLPRIGFVAGVDYWPYDAPEDAVREAKFLLESGRWREIAANGQAKVKPHTWDARAQAVLDKLGESQ